MKKQIVKSHKFEEAKKKLEIFSRKKNVKPKLNRVAETTFFGAINVNVKGKDFNKAISHFHDSHIKTNESILKIFREFTTIYDIFDALDKDYIQSILIAIKSANEASKQADNNYESIKYLINKLQNKFQDIESQYGVILKDINTITLASLKINSIQYLDDVDETYLHSKENKADITELKTRFLNLEINFKKNTDNIIESFNQIRDKQNALKLDLDFQNEVILNAQKKLNQITEKLNSFKHLEDIDKMYVQSLQNKTKINELNNLFLNSQIEFKKNLDKTLDGFDQIRDQQNEIKLDLMERLKVNNENFIKLKKAFTFKLTVVSVIAILSLILSIFMIVKNFMNYA